MSEDRLVASKLSEEIICNHLRIDPQYMEAADRRYIVALKSAAISYICDHCAITPGEVDRHEDLAIAALILISDMYDQRGMYVDKAHINRTVETILSHHDRNFIGHLEVDTDASR